MKQIQRLPFVFVMIAAAVVAAAFLLGASSGTDANPAVTVDKNALPRVRVIEFDDTLARFDSATGAIHRFSGNLSTTSASGTWVQSVRALTANTSGHLQLQEVSGATFLVDIVDGDTWILRRSGSSGSWQKVKLLGG